MTQVTWRAPDQLVDRVRVAARQQGRSVNEFVTRVLDAATDPDLTDDASQQVRERLARAGLLAQPGPPVSRPDPEAAATARRMAGRGTPLAELVGHGRE
ncbi:MAG: hypothetical protein ACRDQA_12650 [Nocardioidaceae bacterium]